MKNVIARRGMQNSSIVPNAHKMSTGSIREKFRQTGGSSYRYRYGNETPMAYAMPATN